MLSYVHRIGDEKLAENATMNLFFLVVSQPNHLYSNARKQEMLMQAQEYKYIFRPENVSRIDSTIHTSYWQGFSKK